MGWGETFPSLSLPPPARKVMHEECVEKVGGLIEGRGGEEEEEKEEEVDVLKAAVGTLLLLEKQAGREREEEEEEEEEGGYASLAAQLFGLLEGGGGGGRRGGGKWGVGLFSCLYEVTEAVLCLPRQQGQAHSLLSSCWAHFSSSSSSSSLFPPLLFLFAQAGARQLLFTHPPRQEEEENSSPLRQMLGGVSQGGEGGGGGGMSEWSLSPREERELLRALTCDVLSLEGGEVEVENEEEEEEEEEEGKRVLLRASRDVVCLEGLGVLVLEEGAWWGEEGRRKMADEVLAEVRQRVEGWGGGWSGSRRRRGRGWF